jgi:polyisoprenyl-phosphate glycosyltransferase
MRKQSKCNGDAERPVIGIVVPCYNEQEVLEKTTKELKNILARMIEKGKISSESCIYYVDDGSEDETWDLISQLSRSDRQIRGIKLANNVGHQNALLAGLLYGKGDALISIDADLQDDIDVIEKMVDEFRDRNVEVVYGVRRRRDTDSFFKRITAKGFYAVSRVLGLNIVGNHADFRLMGRKALDALVEFREVNIFLRGVVPLIGFKNSIVLYDRKERFAGASKYPVGKMMALALDGITSFSVAPLRFISACGVMIFFCSTMLALWVLVSAVVLDNTVPGWASTVLPIYGLGGIQVFCIGIVGEYIGKIYLEAKGRPRFIVDKVIGE